MKGRLSASAVKGTAQILHPELAGYSPAVGLLAASAPHIAANVLGCPGNVIDGGRRRRYIEADKIQAHYAKKTKRSKGGAKNSSALFLGSGGDATASIARELFHRRVERRTGKPYGPVSVSRSRSKAAYWLSTAAVGTMLGVAAGEAVRQLCDSPSDHLCDVYDCTPLRDIDIDAVLAPHGVECNYVNGHWTGVSMARYRRIVRWMVAAMIENGAETLRSEQALEFSHVPFHRLPWLQQLAAVSSGTEGASSGNLMLPLVLQYIWNKAASKQCLLDYLLAFDAALCHSVELHCSPCTGSFSIFSNAYADIRNLNSPLRQEWLEEEFAESRTDSIAFNAQFLTDHPVRWHSNDVSAALESVAAASYVSQSHKVPIKLGRYSFDGATARPDCVEVVVREVIDSLIYDAEQDYFDVSLLPTTAVPELFLFYSELNSGALSNLPVSSSAAEAGAAHYISHGSGRRDIAAADNVRATVTSSRDQYWESSSAGQAWFNLCSDREGCKYLSSTTEGRPYELLPSLSNVCGTLHVLLRGVDRESTGWQKLDEFETFWKHNSASRKQLWSIKTYETHKSFRAAFSDTEQIHREVGSIHFYPFTVPDVDKSASITRSDVCKPSFSLEMELEEKHQLATVVYRNQAGANKILNNNHLRYSRGGGVYRSLLLSIAPDICSLFHCNQQLQVNLGAEGANSSPIHLMNALLCAPWGDGRKQRLLWDISRRGDSMSVTAANVTNEDAALEDAAERRSFLATLSLAVQLLNVSDQNLDSDWYRVMMTYIFQRLMPVAAYQDMNIIAEELLQAPNSSKASIESVVQSLALEDSGSLTATQRRRWKMLQWVLQNTLPPLHHCSLYEWMQLLSFKFRHIFLSRYL